MRKITQVKNEIRTFLEIAGYKIDKRGIVGEVK